jgi:quinol monooxygenase YgiN
MAIGIVATLTVREGKNEEFEQVFGELAAAVRANEPGNEFYSLFKTRDDPQVYKVLERYTDAAAHEAHGGTDHFKAIGARLGPCMAAAPSIELLDGA